MNTCPPTTVGLASRTDAGLPVTTGGCQCQAWRTDAAFDGVNAVARLRELCPGPCKNWCQSRSGGAPSARPGLALACAACAACAACTGIAARPPRIRATAQAENTLNRDIPPDPISAAVPVDRQESRPLQIPCTRQAPPILAPRQANQSQGPPQRKASQHEPGGSTLCTLDPPFTESSLAAGLTVSCPGQADALTSPQTRRKASHDLDGEACREGPDGDSHSGEPDDSGNRLGGRVPGGDAQLAADRAARALRHATASLLYPGWRWRAEEGTADPARRPDF